LNAKAARVPEGSPLGSFTRRGIAIPSINTVTTSGRLPASRTFSDAPISGRAGSKMSIDIAVIDINNAIRAMNSRNDRGGRVAISSRMWVSAAPAGVRGP